MNRRYILCYISYHIFFLLFIFYFSLSASAQPKYEMRGVWIATVSNIDWPSQKGLSSEQQRAEFISILDRLQAIGINAVFVQVRPAADAFYPSQYEPWSEYLTGRQGLPPSDYYDPLAFMISETHKRCMEFHAWINPYRAVFNTKTSTISPTHITHIHPEWFLTYGDKKYFNPGLPSVMHYLNDVAKDIIERYDIDGLHMDDYFYPYRIPGKEFPDNATYIKYGNGMTKDEWRRSNCDSIVAMLHETVVATKPYIKFGISPFGVWRNINKDSIEGSNTKAGQTNYDDLYADILLWLRKGWIDYVAPQIYWEIGHPLADYETLLNWWANHSYGKHVYIGHGIYKAEGNATAAWRNDNELPNQIKMLRENANVQGSIFFSCKDVLNDLNGWADSLTNNYYRMPSIIPPMEWVDTAAPATPIIKQAKPDKQTANFVLQCVYPNRNLNDVKAYLVYVSEDIANLFAHPLSILNAQANTQELIAPMKYLSEGWTKCYITVTALSRENVESNPAAVITVTNEN